MAIRKEIYYTCTKYGFKLEKWTYGDTRHKNYYITWYGHIMDNPSWMAGDVYYNDPDRLPKSLLTICDMMIKSDKIREFI